MSKKISEQPTLAVGTVYDGTEIVLINKNNVTYQTPISKLIDNKMSLTGGVFSGPITLMAGTTSIAPLTLSPGTLLATTVNNSIEYDGLRLYVTDSTRNRKTIRYIDDVIDITQGGTGAITAAAALTALGAAKSATATFTGKTTFAATTTSSASINVPHGTAPTTPVNGDSWTTTAGLFVRINGVTVGPLVSSSASIAMSAGRIVRKVQATAFSASLAIDASIADFFNIGDLTANITSFSITNPVAGQNLVIRFKQNATGNFTVVVPTGAKVSGSIALTASTASLLTLFYNTTDARFEGYWSNIPT